MNLYDFHCEYCEGTVRERIVEQEPVSHHRGIVVLENVPIGICDHCGAHYYAAPVLKRVEAILTSASPPARTLQIPVETF
ncbi:MAG TPA: YgiT-type zinc finger protein [Phycisphaerae bacterium]|nr:YgiT-type zinc finger protein [Phycisphaerae bacterium]